MLGHVAVYEVGKIISRHDESAGLGMSACSFKGEHAAGINIPGQSVDHPLVAYFVLVDKGHRDTATWIDLVFVLTHAEYGAGIVRREFRSGINLEVVITAQLFAVFRQTVVVAVHRHACIVEGHIMMPMTVVLVLRFSLCRIYNIPRKDAAYAKDFYDFHARISILGPALTDGIDQ